MVACENPNTYFLPWALTWNGLNTVDAAAAAMLVLMNVLRFMGVGYNSSSFSDLNPKSGDPEIRFGYLGFLQGMDFIFPWLVCTQFLGSGA